VRVLQAGAPNRRRVACIGSGPASLGCASELAQRGYEVVIYDKNEWPGGLNTYGIAAYKTRAHESLREVKLVEELGVKIQQGVEVGKDVSLAEQKFDAIFIGVGLEKPGRWNCPAKNCTGPTGD
jgi:glutamate synthase (NADPH/NADH) small chain